MAKKKPNPSKRQSGNEYALPPGSIVRIPPDEIKQFRKNSAAKEAIETLDLQPISPVEIIQTWPDLFTLFRACNGSYFAILEGRLEARSAALTAGVDDKTALLIDALSALDRIPPDSINSLLKTARSSSSPKALAGGNRIHIMYGPETAPSDFERLIVLISNLKNSIGPELHQMHYFREGPHKDAAKSIMKIFVAAVEAWNRRSLDPAAHGNAVKYAYGFDYNGTPLQRPLEWIAIQVAREFVEEKQSLPRKGELIEKLTILFPELAVKKPKFWTPILDRAGLSKLEKFKSWKKIKQKKAEKRKSPTGKEVRFSR